jgi:hypothetical protein
MKKHLIIIIIFIVSCSIKKEYSFRKIPCENCFTYNNSGTLNGTYLTLYYAVNYSDSIPLKNIRATFDTIFNTIDIKKYAGVVCWFLKESEELQKIRNCDITDSHNISSDEHKVTILFMYDANTKSLQEINYDNYGNFSSHPFKR